jgi:predicted nucleic acid-binding protein
VAEQVLADTSVWVDHLRYGNAGLTRLLEAGMVWVHDFVIGELASGNLARRQEILGSLAELPRAEPAAHAQVLGLVESEKLMGRGLGWVDLHLLVAAEQGGLKLWSLDKRLAKVATDLRIAARQGS